MAASARPARALFAPLGPTYDRYARLLSFGQDPRWRRFLVSRVEAAPGDTVLDVATGTAAVAIELARRTGCSVVGVDQSPEMLAAGRARVERAGLGERIRLVEGRAEALPFEDASFDALTFTYLYRYVEDAGATLRELARVVRPGGTMASLEFGVPPHPLARALWELYVRVGLPLAGRRDLARLARGRPLPRAEHPRARAAAAARPAARAVARGRDRGRAVAAAEPRRRRRHLGPARVTEARAPGVLRARAAEAGATTSRCSTRRTRSGISPTSRSAPRSRPRRTAGRLAWTLAAFALALGIGAHALDELHGRPLGDGDPGPRPLGARRRLGRGRGRDRRRRGARVDVLAAPARRRRRRARRPRTTSSSGAAACTPTCGSRSPGARFPLLTAYLAVAERLRAEALLAAAFAALLSLAQRRLSTPVRTLRRRVAACRGSDRAPGRPARAARRTTHCSPGPEGALRALTAATVALAVALLVLRF